MCPLLSSKKKKIALKMLHLKQERDLLQNSGSKEHLLVIRAIEIHISSSHVSATKMENQEELEPGHSLAGANESQDTVQHRHSLMTPNPLADCGKFLQPSCFSLYLYMRVYVWLCSGTH